MVTTSQIRKFLTAVNTVSGKVDQFRNSGKGDTLPEDLQMQVKFLKVKLAYQIGRDKSKGGTNVEKFSKNAGLIHSISKALRVGLQVAIYAVGAYLTVMHESTAGVMIAASIIMGRSLSPIDRPWLLINNRWKPKRPIKGLISY